MIEIDDVYFNRIKKLPDLFQYKLNSDFRVGLNFLIKDALDYNFVDRYMMDELYVKTYKTMCRSIPAKYLVDPDELYGRNNTANQIHEFIENYGSDDQILGLIEIHWAVYNGDTFNRYGEHGLAKNTYLNELNKLFKRNAIGFELIDGRIIKADHSVLHNEAIRETLFLISDEDYKNINTEFLAALAHFRNDEYAACMNECNKAIESTMKVICHLNGWTHEENGNSNKLVEVLKQNDFVPGFHESYLNSLYSILRSGVPTFRNKLSGHGAGVKSNDLEVNTTQYVLFLTGSTIRFLLKNQLCRNK